MAFHVPEPSGSSRGISHEWRQQPAHGETCCGDFIFARKQRSNDQILFLIGDVVGKGRRAARVVDAIGHALSAKEFCSPERTDGLGPAELLNRLNNVLLSIWAALGEFEGTIIEPFVVAASVLVDGEAGSLKASSAALPEPRRSQNGAVAAWNLPIGLPLGLGIPGSPPPEEADTILQAGESMWFFTDGVTEAHAPDSAEQFEQSGLGAAILAPSVSPSDLFAKIRDFIGHQGWPQDDTTVLRLARR